MIRIGIISDTHGHLDPLVFKYFENCDEIWHAGDIGTVEVYDRLAEFKPLKAVYGNIDGQPFRSFLPLHSIFFSEEIKVFITHIAGNPPGYSVGLKAELLKEKPDLLVCGHSHLLKVHRDKALNNMLIINPGAAGNHGFHKVKTLVRLEINGNKIQNAEVIEIGKRGIL